MPNEKKKEPPPLCTSTSRRISHKTAIQDLPPGRILCLPDSLISSPSESCSCLCLHDDGTPKNHHDTVSNGPQQEQQRLITTCAPQCKGRDGALIDNIPCCRDMLRRLAEEALSCHPDYAQLDKRVSLQESQDRKSDLKPDCCVASKPVATTPGGSMKKEPILTPSNSTPIKPPPLKKNPCCDIHDCLDSEIPVEHEQSDANEIKSTYQVKPKVKRQEDDCSEKFCTRDASLKHKSSRWTNTESGVALPELHRGSNSTGGSQTPRLRSMQHNTPVLSRNSSVNIAANSSRKLSGKLDKNAVKNIERVSLSTDKNCYWDKEASKNEKKKYNEKSKESCGHRECSVNTCMCCFPPAYGGYYNCTGQISGNCYCDKNN